MTAFRSAQRSFDNESPPEPAHDYTENFSQDRDAYWRWEFVDQNPAVMEAYREWVNARFRAAAKEILG